MDVNKLIIDFLFRPEIEGWLLIAKLVFVAFSAVFVVGIIVFLVKTSWLKLLLLYDMAEFLTFRPFGVRKIEKQWNKIMARLDTGLESEYKLAVIEADSMMDDILRRMGYKGETLGERLKNLTAATLPNIEEVLKVHQTRNNIVHDPDYRLSLDEAREILGTYEQAFRDLQAF